MAIIHLSGFQKTFPFKCCINHHCDGLSQSSWSMIIKRGPKSYLTNFYPPASFHLGRCFCCLSSSFGEYIAMFLSLVFSSFFLSSSFCRAKYDVRYGKTAMCTTTWPTLTVRFPFTWRSKSLILLSDSWHEEVKSCPWQREPLFLLMFFLQTFPVHGDGGSLYHL